MKKLLLKSMLLLCALVVGSSSVWATETPVYTLSFEKLTSGTNYNSYTGAHSITCSSKEWSVYGNQSLGSYIRVGGKNTTATNRTLTSTDALVNKKIYKVTVNHSGIGNGKSSSITVNSITVEGSTNSDFSGSLSKTISSPSVSSEGSLDFELDDDAVWANNSYFKITVNYKITGSNNCYLTINTIDFYEEIAETGESTSVTINSAGITNTDVYTSSIAGYLTASIKDNFDNPVNAVIAWSSSNKNVATVGSDGSLTLLNAGSTTITARYAGQSGVYKSSSTTYNLTVIDTNPNAAGTENNPYTVAQAIAKYDASGVTNDVYVKGYITSKGNVSSGYISYYITDDGTNSFEAYKGKDIGNAAFSTGNEISVGDKVVIFGKLTKYNSTYELDQNNYIISKKSPIAKEVGANGWATYVTEDDVEFEPENAFVVSATGANATLKSVTQVPSGTPLVLKGEGKKYVSTLDATPAAPTNSLAISNGTDDLNGCYVLGVKNGVAGFYKWGGTIITAGKVYLPAPANGSREFLGFDFELGNETTAIENVKAQKTENQYFNLAGQRVAQPTKGLYIVNGKKVIIK